MSQPIQAAPYEPSAQAAHKRLDESNQRFDKVEKKADALDDKVNDFILEFKIKLVIIMAIGALAAIGSNAGHVYNLFQWLK